MKYKHLTLLSIILSTNTVAATYQNKTDFYINTRAVEAYGLQKFPEARLNNTSLVTRLGVRHQQNITDNLLFDTDIRAAYQYSQYTKLTNSSSYIELKRLSVEVPSVFDSPLSTKIGRMSFKDTQTWWYDNELDAVKLFHKETLLSWNLSFAGRLSDERANADDQRVSLEGAKYIIGHLDYHYYYQHHFELFGITEDNGQDKNPLGKVAGINNKFKAYRKLSWLGARIYGEFNKQSSYWGNVAYVDGDTQNLGFTANGDNLPEVTSVNNISVSGLGVDFGFLYKTPKYGLGFSYAYGQGDNKNGNSQKLFLQPNISNNKKRMLGGTRYRYYGEMLDPQLSNIQILSLYSGIPFFDGTYLEFNYHKYTQNTASTQLKSSNLIIQANGVDKDIGQEFDVIWGGKFGIQQELQLVMSSFFGGDAFSNVSQKKDGYRVVIDYKFHW